MYSESQSLFRTASPQRARYTQMVSIDQNPLCLDVEPSVSWSDEWFTDNFPEPKGEPPVVANAAGPVFGGSWAHEAHIGFGHTASPNMHPCIGRYMYVRLPLNNGSCPDGFSVRARLPHSHDLLTLPSPYPCNRLPTSGLCRPRTYTRCMRRGISIDWLTAVLLRWHLYRFERVVSAHLLLFQQGRPYASVEMRTSRHSRRYCSSEAVS